MNWPNYLTGPDYNRHVINNNEQNEEKQMTLIELLQDIVDNAENVYIEHRSRSYRLDDADLPVRAQIAFVKRRLAELDGGE